MTWMVALAALLAAAGPAPPAAQVSFLIADEEYKTAETLPVFAKRDLEPLGIKSTFILAPPRDPNGFPGLEKARDADLLFISVWRHTPTPAQLDVIRRHLAAGKPIVGIRTASHAFSLRSGTPRPGFAEWRTWDMDVLGAHYTGHYGNKDGTDVFVPDGRAPHPILGPERLKFHSGGTLYRFPDQAPGIDILLRGRAVENGKAIEQPVAWTHMVGGSRVFFTSLGFPTDFENPAFRQFVARGVQWALGRIGETTFADFAEPDLPYLASTVDGRASGIFSPADNLTVRGNCLKLGGDTNACFDSDLLRLSVAWRGGFLTERGIAPLSYKNPHTKAPEGQRDAPKPQGEALFGNGIYPGWVGEGQRIEDPRTPAPNPKEVGRGPLPEAMGRWTGLYLDGPRTTVAYTALGAEVREQLSAVAGGVARTIRVSNLETQRRLVLAQLPDGARVATKAAAKLVVEAGGERLTATTSGAPAGAALSVEEGRYLTLALPKRAAGATFRVSLQRGEAAIPKGRVALEPFGRGGPRRWTATAVTTGRELWGGAFAVDDLTLPEPNPWRRRVRLSGITFLPDGRGVVATIDGDIWIVSGIDRGLARLEWRRFASGLNEPQSVVVRNGAIFTFTRNGVVQLHDLNNDGEADYYENFSDLPAQTAETREFPMDMVLRPDGGFYLAKGGQQKDSLGKLNGTVVGLSPDGRKMELVATGLRQPYLGINPKTGLLTASDQQGQWVPSSPVYVVRPGSFFGFRDPRATGAFPTVREPATWLPHHVVQSAAGQVWVTGDKMGPINGHLLCLDYNVGGLVSIFVDEEQGAAHRLQIPFPAALLKAAMNPVDQQLYAVGFQLWGGTSQRLSGMFRVRYTGAPDASPIDVRSDSKGVLIRFAEPLDPAASAVERYNVRRWNYARTASYGSGFYRLDGKAGQEELYVHGARLSEDRKSVFVMVDDMRPAMQMHVVYRVRTARGQEFVDEVYLTVAQPRANEALRAEFQGLDLPVPPRTAVVRHEAIAVTAASGQEIALRLGCVSCHSPDGTTQGRNGPTWKGLFGSKRRFGDGGEVVADDSYLHESIYDPSKRVIQEFVGKDVGMPSYVGIIEEDQVKALILYIRTLK